MLASTMAAKSRLMCSGVGNRPSLLRAKVPYVTPRTRNLLSSNRKNLPSTEGPAAPSDRLAETLFCDSTSGLTFPHPALLVTLSPPARVSTHSPTDYSHRRHSKLHRSEER